MASERSGQRNVSLQRRIRRWVAILVIVLGAGLVVVARTPVCGWIVVPRIESVTGLDISADSVYVSLRGDVVLVDARVRIPGMDGPAGEFLHVAQLNARPQWTRLLSGSVRVRRINLVAPTVRVSQSTDDSTLNLGFLPMPRGKAGPALVLPRITVSRAALELGEHSGTDYNPLKRLTVSGSLTPSGGEPASYALQLIEDDPPPGGPRVELTGRVDNAGLQVKLTGVSLRGWGPESVPSPVRPFFTRLELDGGVRQATFEYRNGVSIGPRIELSNVSLNLLVPPEEGGPPPPRLERVNGFIEVDPDGITTEFTGWVEDLHYQVAMRVDGFSFEAPFTCTLTCNDFLLERHPQLLPHAPAIVRENLQRFSSPTAIIDATVTIARSLLPDGSVGGVEAAGAVRFSDAHAAYEEFPYLFHDLSGTIIFDADRLEIRNVTGRAVTGATLTASGWVAPPDDEARLEIHVIGRDVPIDDVLMAALADQRREVVTALFNRDRYRELLDRGVIRAPGDHAAPGGSPPEFGLGGTFDADIIIRRDPDLAPSKWQYDITLDFPRVGLLAKWFPLPLVGENVRVHIDKTRVRLVDAVLRGLGGGEAVATGSVEFRDPTSRLIVMRPDIRIDAKDIPLDERLLGAISQPDVRLDDGRVLSGSTIVRGLGASGEVDASVAIVQRPDRRVGYDASVDLSHVVIEPPHDPADVALMVGPFHGRFDLSESRLSIDVAGDAQTGTEHEGVTHAGSVIVRGEMDFIKGDEPSLDVRVLADGADAAAPFERLVAPFSPSVAASIASARATYEPIGRAQAIVTLRTGEDGGVRSAIEVGDVTNFEFNCLGGRMRIADASGTFAAVLAPNGRVEFRQLACPIEFTGERSCIVTFDGWLPADAFASGRWDSGNLTISIRDARFDSPLATAIVDRLAPEAVADWWRSAAPSGAFIADVTCRNDDGSTSVDIQPISLAYTSRGQRISFSAVQGRMTLGKDHGRFTNVLATAPDWTLRADGEWSVTSSGVVNLAATLGVTARALSTDLKAALPEGVARAFDALALDASSLRVNEATFAWSTSDDRSLYDFAGQVAFEDARLNAGFPITRCAGVADIHATNTGESFEHEFQVHVLADRFSVAGFNLTRGKMRIENGAARGSIAVPLVAAEAYGGTVSGEGAAYTVPDVPPAYFIDLRVADVRFGPLLADYARSHDDSEPRESPASDDRSRGLLDGQVRLAGLAGRPASRRGSGFIQVSGGKVIELPLATRIIEVSNLQPPANADLDYAIADFYIDGDTIAIEDASVFSSAISIIGQGVMDWPTTELDMRFMSRAARQIPFFSPIIESIRNEMITSAVKGPVRKPDVSLVPLASTRRFLADALGARSSPSEQRLDRVEREALERAVWRGDPPQPIRPTPNADPPSNPN